MTKHLLYSVSFEVTYDIAESSIALSDGSERGRILLASCVESF